MLDGNVRCFASKPYLLFARAFKLDESGLCSLDCERLAAVLLSALTDWDNTLCEIFVVCLVVSLELVSTSESRGEQDDNSCGDEMLLGNLLLELIASTEYWYSAGPTWLSLIILRILLSVLEEEPVGEPRTLTVLILSTLVGLGERNQCWV